jgi:hypothetical protein
VPLSIARAPARSLPSRMTRLLCRMSNPLDVFVSGRSVVVLTLVRSSRNAWPIPRPPNLGWKRDYVARPP